MTVVVPYGEKHSVVCKFTGALDFTKLRAELPVNGLSFSKVLNGSGPWAGTLSVEDLGMRRASWQEATAVNRTMNWIYVDGVLLYGGRTTGRRYTASTGKV